MSLTNRIPTGVITVFIGDIHNAWSHFLGLCISCAYQVAPLLGGWRYLYKMYGAMGAHRNP